MPPFGGRLGDWESGSVTICARKCLGGRKLKPGARPAGTRNVALLARLPFSRPSSIRRFVSRDRELSCHDLPCAVLLLLSILLQLLWLVLLLGGGMFLFPVQMWPRGPFDPGPRVWREGGGGGVGRSKREAFPSSCLLCT